MFRIALLALLAALALAAPAHAASRWLEEQAPFGEAPALQFEAGTSMAPDGTVVAARLTPAGDVEVSERPPGGPFGAPVTVPRVLGIPRPGQDLQVLAGRDGTAAVLFDAGNLRWASVRRPGGAWSDPDVVALPGGVAMLAPDGELWSATRSPAHAEALWVTRLPGGDIDVVELPLPPQGWKDQAPALAVPSSGRAHVVFIEGRVNEQDCTREAKILAVDVTRTEAAPLTALDGFTADGDGQPCQLEHGAFPERPQLVTSLDGSDTLAYAVDTFDDARTAVRVRHRQDDDEDWGPTERIDGDPQAVVEQLIGGRGAPVMTVREPGGLVDVTIRREGGGWSQGALLAALALPVEGVRTGTGSAVFAWTGGARVRGAVLERDGTLGDTVAIAPAQDLLGVGGDFEGDAVVLYERPAGGTFALRTAGFDAAPPRIGEVGIPATGRAGEGAPFIVDADDVWGPVSATWDFGDGTQEHAIATGHEFAAPGEHTVKVTVEDAAGNTATASGRVSIGPSLRPVQPTLPASARDSRAPRFFKLSVRGRTLTVAADEGGRLALRLTRRGHRAHRIDRLIGAGVQHIPLPRLSPGTWRATLTVTDAAGNRSREAGLAVRVKRPRTRPHGTRAA